MIFPKHEQYRYILLFSLFIAGVGCADRDLRRLPPPILPQANSPSPKAKDVFIPGDSMELFVEEDPSFNGIYTIRPGGYILIPRIGRVQISGLDREEAERHMTQTLQKGQLAKAKVLVEHLKSGRTSALSSPEVPKMTVYLTGSVSKPGVHQLPLVKNMPMGLYEAILITGGLTRFGNHGKVEILRADGSGRRVRTVVDIRPIRDGGAVDPPLIEGDIVNVSEKIFGF